MPYELESRLVIGVASSALFDLTDSDMVFRSDGEDAYRRYQADNIDVTLGAGVAFPFVRRLLALNDLQPGDPVVEVIVLSKNDPSTGLRVMRSIAAHALPMSRAVFTQGEAPHRYMSAFGMSLFLSADERDVKAALGVGQPAGQVLPSAAVEDLDDGGVLRVAFDFDGVLADDGAERVYQAGTIADFREYETVNRMRPHGEGPLKRFLVGIDRIQRIEQVRSDGDRDYVRRLRVSLVTARDAPAHERAVRTLEQWGVTVNDAFFLGGIDKGRVLEVLRPHIFFDDQTTHLASTACFAPSVHIP